jgi:hypothetical protein
MSAVAMKRISEQELQRIYSTRFGKNLEYRRRVWNILVSDFFSEIPWRTSGHIGRR